MATLLITGATGYLGSRLVHGALAQGHAVRFLARAESDTYRLAEVMSQLLRFDLKGSNDTCTLAKALCGMGGEDIIVHCATAYGRKGESEAAIFAANRDFPAHLLKAASRAGVSRFINTDTVLPEETGAYAASKSDFRKIALTEARAGYVKVTNLALEHFYGPGDDDTKFPIWVTRTCLTAGAKLNLTDGNQLRDFLFIDDVVAAYLAVLGGQQAEQWAAWHVGSGRPVSIRVFVETIHRACGAKATLNFGAVPSRIEPPASPPQQSLSHSGIIWTPEWSIEQGIAALVASELKALASP